jgi:hypothetical protein
MGKINNETIYVQDTDISDLDFLIGTNGNTDAKTTKNFLLGSLRTYFLSGLSPLTGGTLSFTEITYNGGLYSTFAQVVNALDPNVTVLQYHVVVVALNGTKAIFRLQNRLIGVGQTAVIDANFIELPTSTIANVGSGVGVYKESVVSGKNTLFNLKSVIVANVGTGTSLVKETVSNTNDITTNIRKIKSSTLNLSIVSDDVVIEIPTVSDIPSLIVNSDYTGTEELGTSSKPFKNLQNALDAYVGNGVSNKAPDLLGTIIKIQKESNVFTGSLAYAGLNIEIANGVNLITNPSASNYVLDLDSDAVLPTNINYSMIPFSNTEIVDVKITILEGATLQGQKSFAKNRGNNNISGPGKIIKINGKGTLINLPEVSIVSPSVKNLFSLNEDNQVGFVNGGNTANVGIEANISSNNSQIAYIGLSTKYYSAGNLTEFGQLSTAFNSNTVPFIINGGEFVGDSADITNEYNNAPTYSLVTLIKLTNGAYFFNDNAVVGKVCENVFLNGDTGSTTTCSVVLNNCNSTSTQTNAVFKSLMSSNIWNVRLTNCNFAFWGVDENKIALIPSSINTLGGKVVETLSEYASKNAAITAGLFKGSKFINKTDITAGSFVVGVEYKILTIGTTDFTLIGASTNTVGLYFTASGVGTGTGTASLIKIDIVI